MANYTHHESCPNCGSRDNLACYDDGSKWCFGCRYYEPPQGLARLHSTFRKMDDGGKWGDLFLPDDATYRLQQNHLDWLGQYDITRSEIIRYRIMSSKEKGLILPIFNNKEELLFYVNRPMQVGKPKSLDNGRKPFVIFKGTTENSDTVVLVEDYISALKVSRVAPAVPLFGSFCSLEVAARLAKRFSTCLLWLDRDKAKESLRQALRLSPYFKVCRSVITDLDPKFYNKQEIEDYVQSRR